MKKFLFSFILIICLSFLFSFVCSAEEYIFTVTEDFPMPYSTSIEVVSEKLRMYTTENIDDIDYLIEAGLVDYCQPMSYSELFDYTTEDEYYSEQTNLTQVLAQFSWNKGVFGDNVKIAVIDSGLYNAASDFNTKKIIRAKDYTSTQTNTGNYYCLDEIGHGSMVTGIIAASHNTRGVAGIAPNVEIYIFKCFYLDELGNQKAKNSDVISAMEEAIDTYGVDIINFSGGSLDPDVFKSICDYAEEKGVLIVSAVGNYGSYSDQDKASAPYYPASYDNVIGVGSIKADGHRASHSQRNDYVDIMAPGENIYSVRLGGYEKGSGTSFATPHITAALALAKSLNPELTAKELSDALYASANPMTDRFSGNGSLNIQSLLTYIQATINKGSFVYSSSSSSMFAYCIPLDGYRAYFAKYEDDMLTDIKETGINAQTKDFANYIYYIWKKDTLEPYTGDVPVLKY